MKGKSIVQHTYKSNLKTAGVKILKDQRKSGNYSLLYASSNTTFPSRTWSLMENGCNGECYENMSSFQSVWQWQKKLECK